MESEPHDRGLIRSVGDRPLASHHTCRGRSGGVVNFSLRTAAVDLTVNPSLVDKPSPRSTLVAGFQPTHFRAV